MKINQNKFILLIVISVIFYAIIVSFSDFDLLKQKISEFDWKYLPLIFSLMILHTIISAVKFHRMLKTIEINIPFSQSLKIFVAGLSLSVTPGGIGIVIKSYILKKYHSKSIASTLPLILMERWTELVAILLVSSALLYWANLTESVIIIGVGFGFAVILFLMISNVKVFLSLKKIISKIPYISKFSPNLDESEQYLAKLVTKRRISEAITWSIAAKIFHVITIYLIFLSFGVDLGLFISAQIYYTSLILGVVTLIPAGIIITESNMIGLLSSQGVELASASLIVILTRIVTMWSTTFAGLIILKFGFRTD